MKNKQGAIIIAGKTKMLLSEIVDFGYNVTSSELEAFILEINLIKKYDSHYNILLRDNKSYLYIIENDKYTSLVVKRIQIIIFYLYLLLNRILL